MPLSQTTLINSSDPSTTLNHLLDNVNQILKRARGEMFAPLEQVLHQAFAEAERQCMQQLMETFDWDYPTFNSGGELYFQSSRNNKRYMTLAGEVTIERSLYRTERNGPPHLQSLGT